MMITPENIVRHELIGLTVEVTQATDPAKVGIKGKVVDESRQTLVIERDSQEVTLPKEESTFLFQLSTAEVEVKGSLLQGRPEERLKNKLPGRWETNKI